MVRRARTTTSAPNKASSILGQRRAFTLIEILLVLAIVSMVMALGLPAISRVTYQRLNSTTRKFVGIVHTIRNDAILLNSIYRLSIDLDNQTWWVESQKSFQLLTGAENNQPIVQVKPKGSNAPPPPQAPTNFAFAEKYSKKPVPMPGGCVFTGVLKERDGLHKSGIAYVYFFPNGFNEQAILYLGREGSESKGYSVLIRPTSGRVEIFREFLTGFNQ